MVILKLTRAAAVIGFALLSSTGYASTPMHGFATYGELKYPTNFKNFEYVNPGAPRAGTVRLSMIGTFDNLNPFVLKGISAVGSEYIFETLLQNSKDEPFSAYGLLASSVEVADDKSWVKFKLRPEAKWSDGKPVTVEDVIFSFDTLKSKGHPNYRMLLRDVKTCEKLSAEEVKFTFANTTNKELPIIVGASLPIISKAFFTANEFDKTTLTPIIGSGPYVVEKTQPPASITYKRREDYWGKDLPINRGRYNFERMVFDYYRDETVAVQALKAGRYDMRLENIARMWSTAYDSPAVKAEVLKKGEFKHENPSGMQGFVFNLRREKFKNPKTREALNYAFDYEWANKNLFYSLYKRNRSYFGNSAFESKGIPQGRELEILNKYKDKLPPEVFTTEYNPPKNDGSGNSRDNLLKAKQLLMEAGWKLENNILKGTDDKPFEIEFLIETASFERVFSGYIKNLERLGIKAHVRLVDSAQYQKRKESFDFDMMVNVFPQSMSPGNEQIDYWTSQAADTRGSRNIIGIKNPVVDELVEKLLAVESYDDLVATVSALDRVLLWNHYVVPNWHSGMYRVAYWDRFGRPDVMPKYDLGFTDTWWIDTNRNSKVDEFLGKK